MSCFGVLCTVIFKLAYPDAYASAPAARPHATTPTLTQAEVARAARGYLIAQGVKMDGVKEGTPQFRPHLGKWLILYDSGSLAIGEGNFGVFVADDDIRKIRPMPSR